MSKERIMNWRIQEMRNKARKFISEFLEKDGFLETETPILSKNAIPESGIRLFETKRITMNGDDSFYLLPSPELYMKRLLFCWRKSIYQFSKCFRNSEQRSKEHCNEFTMLEYYKIGENDKDQARRTQEMIIGLFDECGAENKFKDFRYMSMSEAVKSASGLDLEELQDEKRLRASLDSIGITVYDESESWADSFNRLFVSRVEPILPCQDKPLVLYDYPTQIECLAKDANDMFKRRWELYYKGIELANCYFEASDSEAIIGYLNKESEEIAKSGLEFRSDMDLASFSPLPSSSGVAMGFDRLMMLLLGKNGIDEVLPFCEYLL